MKRWGVLWMLAAGCASPSATVSSPGPAGARPMPVVAVLAEADPAAPADAGEFAQILALELMREGRTRVVRPSARDETLPHRDEDLVRRARALGADAVIAAALVDCDPYDPPRLALRVQLFRATPRQMSGDEIDRLVSSASWRKGPVALSPQGAAYAAAAFEAVYDARDEEVRAELRDFTRRRGRGDSAFPQEREFSAVQSRYFEFVAHQVVRRLGPELVRSW